VSLSGGPRPKDWRAVVLAIGGVVLLLVPSAAAQGRTPAIIPSPGPVVPTGSMESPAAAPSGPGPVGWFNLTNQNGPTPRELAAIAYDPVANDTVLFGGGQFGAGVIYDDTWAYSNGTWTQLHPALSPPGLIGAGLVYDASDGYMLLFGGYDGSFSNETWAFSGGQWRQLLPLHAPSVRWLFGMTYSASDRGVLLFGGGDFSPLGDTWLFRSGNWTRLAPSTSPPWRSDSALAYDPLLDESILFGGSGNSTTIGDTWAWQGGTWHPVSTTANPPASTDNGLAYDPVLGAVVLATGGTSPAEPTAESWAFNATGWHNLTRSLGTNNYPSVHHQTAAWDGADHYLLQFGGVGSTGFSRSTWALDVLNATAGPTSLTGEAPLNLGVTANISGGIAPLTPWWNLSGVLALTTANGSLPIATAGYYELLFTVRDSVGESVTIGPFQFVAVAPVQVTANASPSSGVAPLNVSFTGYPSKGIGPYTYNWSFGDGSIGTGETPQHTYRNGGTFLVKLVVRDAAGRNATAELNVTVEAPSTPRSSVPPPQSLPLVDILAGITLVAVLAGLVAFALLRGRPRRQP
jgi:PKD repeat protein